MELPESVLIITGATKGLGGKALIVGGAVRDHIIGSKSKDIDIEIYGLEFERIVAMLERLGFDIDMVGRAFQVIKINGEAIDVSMPRRDSKIGVGHRGFKMVGDPNMSPTEAAMRRDFTINSIAYDPWKHEIIDPFNGVADIKIRRLKHTSASFIEDPLRVLRGMQFIGRFDLIPDPATVELCKTLSMDELAKERVLEEWEKLIIKGGKISRALQFLANTGWVQYFPELERLIGLEQDSEWHPEGDVWTHTKLCMDAFGQSKGDESKEDQLITGFSVLCHDFGKATTTEFKDGRIRSHGHEKAGEEPTKSFLGRMIETSGQKKPSKFIDQIMALVTNHLAPTSLYNSGCSQSAIRRLANKVGRIDLLCWVSQCDKAGRGSAEFTYKAEDWLRDQARQLSVLDSKPKPIIMGRHLISILGMTPSSKFKELLNYAYDGQMEGIFHNIEGGINYLREKD